MQEVIFVVGAPRSGTTLVTRCLEACGATLGDVTSLAEHRRFADDVLKAALSQAGFDPRGQRPIPDGTVWDDADPYRIRQFVEEIEPGVDCFKNPKIVFLWRILARAFPEAHWIVTWRNPTRSAESCMELPSLNTYITVPAWFDWIQRYRRGCSELTEVLPEAQVHHIRVDEIFPAADYEPLASAVAACGLEWRSSAVRRIFDPQLWH